MTLPWLLDVAFTSGESKRSDLGMTSWCCVHNRGKQKAWLLDVAFTSGESKRCDSGMTSWCCVHKRGKQKAWLRHDFLMLRSQAGKAKGVTEAWLLDVAFTSGESKRHDLGMTSWCCVHKRGKQKAWLRHDFLMLRSQAGKAKGVT